MNVLSVKKMKNYKKNNKKKKKNDGQKKKYKRTNNDLQNTMQKTKDRATRTPLKTGCELRCSGEVSSSCSTCGIRRVTHQGQKN